MILAAVTVGFESNGPAASSIVALLAPDAQTSAGETACSCLQSPAVLPLRPHRLLLLPPLARPCSDGSLTPQPNQRTLVLLSAWAFTAASSLAPCRPLPRPRRRPAHCPGALSATWSTWSTTDFHRKSTVRGEADSWVHGHTPVFFVICQASRFVRPVGLQIFQDEESFIRLAEKRPISNEKWAVHF